MPPEPPELLPAVPQPSHVAQRRRVRLEIPRVRRGDLHRAPPRERVADGFVFPGGGANIVVVVTRRARRTSSAEDVARVRGGVHLERLRGVLSAVFARVERRGGERGAGPVVPPGVARARGRRTRRGRGSGRANRGLEPKRRVHVRGEPRGERRGGRGVVARGGGRGVVGVVVVIRGHGGGGGGRFRARGAGEVVLPGVAAARSRSRSRWRGSDGPGRDDARGDGSEPSEGAASSSPGVPRGGGARFGRARRGARAGRRLRTGFGGSRRAEGGGGRAARPEAARARVVAGGARPGGATSIRGRRARALRADAHAGEGGAGASPPRAEGAAPSAGAIATPGARRGCGSRGGVTRARPGTDLVARDKSRTTTTTLRSTNQPGPSSSCCLHTRGISGGRVDGSPPPPRAHLRGAGFAAAPLRSTRAPPRRAPRWRAPRVRRERRFRVPARSRASHPAGAEATTRLASPRLASPRRDGAPARREPAMLRRRVGVGFALVRGVRDARSSVVGAREGRRARASFPDDDASPRFSSRRRRRRPGGARARRDPFTDAFAGGGAPRPRGGHRPRIRLRPDALGAGRALAALPAAAETILDASSPARRVALGDGPPGDDPRYHLGVARSSAPPSSAAKSRGNPSSVAVAADGRVAVGTTDGVVVVCEPNTRHPRGPPLLPAGGIGREKKNTFNLRASSSDGGGLLECVAMGVPTPGATVSALAFCAVASSRFEGAVSAASSGGSSSASFAAKASRWVLAGHRDGSALLWDASSGKCVREFRGAHATPVVACAALLAPGDEPGGSRGSLGGGGGRGGGRGVGFPRGERRGSLDPLGRLFFPRGRGRAPLLRSRRRGARLGRTSAARRRSLARSAAGSPSRRSPPRSTGRRADTSSRVSGR